MTTPIGLRFAPVSAARGVPSADPGPGAAAAPRQSFAAALGAARSGPSAAAPPVSGGAAGPLDGTARRVLARLFAEERAVDRALAAAMGGRLFTTGELIALQAKVIRYSQELDVASRLVEKATSAVKQVMATQV